uniref:ATP synthase complex subunit 8 n=1 Tax=Callulina kreffti TaxID=248777 RepID=S4V0F6_9NEOB|nr:ATP synthase F0 subunit 8 [Callulina kreffti]
MPQLILHPWFNILVMTWIILIVMIPTKILSYINLNPPLSSSSAPKQPTWSWPWT